MEKEGTEKKSTARGRWTRANAVALSVLAIWMTLFGADKSPATRALQRLLSRTRSANVVTAEDVAHGWRGVSSAEAERPVEMPAGAVTNELLRRRGGFDWAFRVEPEGWRSSWRGGFLDGLTVLARGEVRPDVGTLYYPVPLTNGVSLLPEARWGLLPNGEESVFSHAVTTNGSLLLDWRNALVGRDPNAPTNLQFEIFSDGSFVWRTDGGSTSYLPVLPFDYDGDGLENSVDPEPLVPNPVDAHGTPPEWYRVVCSNVFTVAEDPNIPTFKNSNINSNAYYFVDVVAEEGPAPIWFNADRDSRLGSPVVVARAGETNRVPLLIGVEYAVTSTVPISVSRPEDGYAEVNRSDERNCVVKWPLEFEFVPSASGAYTVNVGPYDPGGTFSWEDGTPRMVPRLMSASLDSSCRCWSGSGASVTFNCTECCSCTGGCRARGSFVLEDSSTLVEDGECRCGFDDPDPEYEQDIPPSEEASLTIEFSSPAVIFEDRYEDSPGHWVKKRSTRVRLSVMANGGAYGATLAFSSRNLEKLSPIFGERISLPSSLSLPPGRSFFSSCIYEGVYASSNISDIVVSGVLTPEDGGLVQQTNIAEITSVRVEICRAVTAPSNPCLNRHEFGIGERMLIKQNPPFSLTSVTIEGGSQTMESDSIAVDWNVQNTNHTIRIGCSRTSYIPNVSVIFPNQIVGRGAYSFPTGVGRNEAGGIRLMQGFYVLPERVSFRNIAVQEVPCSDVIPPEGYYAFLPDSDLYPRSHTRAAGAGRWYDVDANNRVGGLEIIDGSGYSQAYSRMTPSGELTENKNYGWLGGRKVWRIPFGWQVKGTPRESLLEPIAVFFETRQVFTITADGSFSIEKLGHSSERRTNDWVFTDGSFDSLATPVNAGRP